MARWTIIFPLIFSCFAGCSLVLDTDVLQDGADEPRDSDTTVAPECEADRDCSDNFDCTVDQCGANGRCVHLANNSLCGEFEICSPETGCTPTGIVCDSNADCDDNIFCTIDMCTNGSCRNTVDHSRCSNSVPFCRETALCIPEAGGCVEGDEILCDAPSDGICLAATCNEQTGICEEHLSSGADNDTDGYLDAQCGGDDCNDNDALVYPAATETCNGVDNDCDGAVDALFKPDSAVTVVEASQLSRIRVAQNGPLFGALYQSDITHTAVVEEAGTVLEFDLSTLHAGTPVSGDIIADPIDTDAFLMVWNAVENGTAETLVVARLTYHESDHTLTGELLSTLDSQATPQSTLMDCDIVYDAARADAGWAVAWTEMDSSTAHLFFQAHDMSSALNVADNIDDTGSVSTVSLTPVAAADYILNVAADWTAASGGNTEIFEARVQLDTAFSVTTPVAVISPMDTDGVDDIDPSLSPVVTADQDGHWYSVYVDHFGFGSLNTIALWDGATQLRQEALPTPVTHAFRGVQLVYTGANLALLYIVENTTAVNIVLKQLTPTGVGTFTQDASGTLRSIAAGGTDSFTDLHAAATPQGTLAMGWVVQDAAGSRLQLTSLGTCTPL